MTIGGVIIGGVHGYDLYYYDFGLEFFNNTITAEGTVTVKTHQFKDNYPEQALMGYNQLKLTINELNKEKAVGRSRATVRSTFTDEPIAFIPALTLRPTAVTSSSTPQLSKRQTKRQRKIPQRDWRVRCQTIPTTQTLQHRWIWPHKTVAF